MGEPATNYIPVEIYQRFRQQAVRVWVVGLVVVLIWAAAIVAAPLLKAYGFLAVSGPLYHFYSLMCHQIPDRSFHVAGEQFGVCSRWGREDRNVVRFRDTLRVVLINLDNDLVGVLQ